MRQPYCFFEVNATMQQAAAQMAPRMKTVMMINNARCCIVRTTRN